MIIIGDPEFTNDREEGREEYVDIGFVSKGLNDMDAFKTLLDHPCGTTNPLVKLTQIYTHAPQNVSNEQIIAPNTFHVESLLTSLRAPDPTVNQLEHSWTEEFLNLPSKSIVSNVYSERIPWNDSPPFPSLFLHPNPLFFDQQPSSIDTEFDHDTVRATQNILSYLQERQYANHTEKQSSDADRINVNSTEREQQIDPFVQGLKRLEIHDIPNAILFFQMAVQQQPDHIDAWLCLGITQTENEQDGPAIIALKKCVALDPKNLQAYITLASCYANELLKTEAFDSLYRWLANNSKYSHLLSDRSAEHQLNFESLKDLFLRAVSWSNNSDEIDIDLQVCLGILFYLHEDYSKAVECFQTAVLAKPNDALLWNKLGATIANGGENAKAVNAYYHALSLSPGYIRARYNLGISCLNLKAYKPAIEHCLIALKLQSTRVNMSENIWRTLTIAVDHLQRSDLHQSVVSRDLSRLIQEFQIDDEC